jgi:mono/diheme cytochrome c family protein
MIGKFVAVILALAVIGLAAFWLLTTPKVIAASELPAHTPDLANGQMVFWAGGCESCHAVANADGDERLRLGGGQVLATPVGRFHVPNISPDPGTGIGKWTLADFVTAMKRGIAPGGVHLYPAFPYPSYQRLTTNDVIDLKAFLDSLPPVVRTNEPHELAFPFNIRRGIGLWQLVYVDGKAFVPDAKATDQVNRGAYLVQGPGHCGECHTPRNPITQATDPTRTLSGAVLPDGTNGVAPNITPDPSGIGTWTPAQITRLLTTGLKPTSDSVAGAMGPVVASVSMLARADLQAIAAYLKSIPPHAASAVPKTPQPGGPAGGAPPTAAQSPAAAAPATTLPASAAAAKP